MEAEGQIPTKPPIGLSALSLNAEELAALAEQGFVAEERRSGDRVYYKLRFRTGKKQHVRYLGNDAAVANRVRAELLQLQASGRRRRALMKLARTASQTLREAKQHLEPLFLDAGFAFHGLAVRQTRRGVDPASKQPVPSHSI